MTTTRGFVERIEVGRGGLVAVSLVRADASRATFVVSDIDGDPERFNERLSKVAVLRDAMNRAEPVEIEHDKGEFGEEIQRAARISRDALDPPGSVEQVTGLVVQVVAQSRNALQGAAESHDDARVFVLGLDGGLTVLRLDLQAPERLVAVAQLEMIRDAQLRGSLCLFLVSRQDDGFDRDILAVAATDGDTGTGRNDGEVVSAFVESLGLLLPPGAGAAAAALAVARVTTAPELSGPGGTVDQAPFTPATLELYLAKGSLTYALVEAGLRDNVRMRLGFVGVGDRGDGIRDGVGFRDATHAAELASRYRAYVEPGAYDATGSGDDGRVRALLLGAELLAPLASASRPVWLRIDREMLDRGPEAGCTPGLPSTDLNVSSLRDLRIPYPAQWIGFACFNHGVYRFQVTAPPETTLQVDDEPLCLYDAGTDGVLVGYACLDEDHTVTVEIPAYTCDTDFELDVYRIR